MFDDFHDHGYNFGTSGHILNDSFHGADLHPHPGAGPWSPHLFAGAFREEPNRRPHFLFSRQHHGHSARASFHPESSNRVHGGPVMRLLVLIVLLLPLAGCPKPTNPPAPPELTWTGTGNPAIPLCTATVTKGCLTTYTIYQDGVVLAQNIPATALAYVATTLPPAGTHTYQLKINAVNPSGTVVASPPASTTVVVP